MDAEWRSESFLRSFPPPKLQAQLTVRLSAADPPKNLVAIRNSEGALMHTLPFPIGLGSLSLLNRLCQCA